MLKPRPYQVEGLAHVTKLMQTETAFVEGSTTGYGKTVVVALAAKACGLQPAVVCPKSVINHWKETFAKVGIEPLFVLTPNAVKNGHADPFGRWKIRNKQWNWLFPEKHILIFDEAHMYRTRKTQNGKLLTGVRRCPGTKAVLVSATLGESPLDMFVTGQVLSLHNGDDDFYHWCKAYGCVKGKWGMEYKLGAAGMVDIHKQIYPSRGHRCDASKLEGFPKSQVDTVGVASDDASKVQKQLDALAEKREMDAALPVVDRLRARQAVELLKVAALTEMAANDVTSGNNVVIFVNFIETLNALQHHFGEGKCSVIHGSQTTPARELNQARFQNNEVNVIICQIKSGGQSIDLHDLYGRPRVSYLCPSDSATATVQALGRTPRSGAMSTSIQHMVFATGTIEEKVRQRVEGKIENIAALNDGDLDLFNTGGDDE